MSKRKATLMLVAVAALGFLWIGQAVSQQAGDQGGGGGRGGRGGNRGNFDPAQMRQRMLDNIKETLGASDEEWTVLSPKVEKVMTLSFESRFGGMGMMGRGGRRGQGGADGGPTSRPSMMPQSDTQKAAQALSTVLEDKSASASSIKSALQNLRDAKAKSKAELAQAQKELQEVLTVRQEAQLVSMGLLE